MATIFDGLTIASDSELRSLLATLKTVTFKNTLGIYGTKAHSGIASAVNFVGGIFGKKQVLEKPTVKEMDVQIEECNAQLQLKSRPELLAELRSVLHDRGSASGDSDEAIAIAVVNKAAKHNNIDTSLSLAYKTDAVYTRYAERMIAEMQKKLNNLSSSEQAKFIRTLNEDIDALSPAEREAMQKALKVEKITGETVAKMLGTTGGSTLVLTAFTGFGSYIAITTIMHALFTTAMGVTLPFAAYTGATSIFAMLTGPVGWIAMGGLALWQFSRGSNKVDGEVLSMAVFLARLAYGRTFVADDSVLPSYTGITSQQDVQTTRQNELELARLRAACHAAESEAEQARQQYQKNARELEKLRNRQSAAKNDNQQALDKIAKLERELAKSARSLRDYEARERAELAELAQVAATRAVEIKANWDKNFATYKHRIHYTDGYINEVAKGSLVEHLKIERCMTELATCSDPVIMASATASDGTLYLVAQEGCNIHYRYDSASDFITFVRYDNSSYPEKARAAERDELEKLLAQKDAELSKVNAENARYKKLIESFESQRGELERLRQRLEALDSENRENRREAQQKVAELSQQLASSINQFEPERYADCIKEYQAKFKYFPAEILDNIVTGILMRDYLANASQIAKAYELSMFCILKSIETLMFDIYDIPHFRSYVKDYFKAQGRKPHKEPSFSELCNIIREDRGNDWRAGFAADLDTVRKARNKTMHKDLAKDVDYDNIHTILFVGKHGRSGMLEYLNSKLMELRRQSLYF